MTTITLVQAMTKIPEKTKQEEKSMASAARKNGNKAIMLALAIAMPCRQSRFNNK